MWLWDKLGFIIMYPIMKVLVDEVEGALESVEREFMEDVYND